MSDLSPRGLTSAINHWQHILEQPEDVIPSRVASPILIESYNALRAVQADRDNLADANRVLRRQLARVASERDAARFRLYGARRVKGRKRGSQ